MPFCYYIWIWGSEAKQRRMNYACKSWFTTAIRNFLLLSGVHPINHEVNSQKQKPSLRCRPSMKKTRLTTSNTWIFDKRMVQIYNYTWTNMARRLARKEYIKSFIMASTKYWNQTLSPFIVVVREAVNHLWFLKLNNACGGFVKRMLAVELRSRFGICQQPYVER